jgi:putative DNA primase/helicase
MKNKVDKFLNRLENVTKAATNQYKAKCPAHDDKVESFSVNITDDKINFYCHAGCSEEDILSEMNLKWSDLFFNEQKKEIVKTYNYTDKEGELLYQAVRYKPKSFRQRRPQPDGNGWVWNLGNTQRVLYNLPAVLKAVNTGQVVYIVEGEKDADNLIKEGLTATTAPMGAGKWEDSYTKTLAGAKVVIIPDNDKPGLKYANKVAELLLESVESLKILDLQYREDKEDISDWLNKDFNISDLEKNVENCPLFEQQEEEIIKDFKEFLPSPIAEEIIKDLEINKNIHIKYIAESGLFYMYDKGVWGVVDNNYLKKIIREFLKECNEKWDKNYKINEVYQALKSILLDSNNKNLFNAGYKTKTNLVNIKNGMLDWKDKLLIDHDPEYYSQFQIPIKYEPEAQCPLWEKSLKEWIPEKQARLFLQEYVGYSLIPDNSFQKFLILHGSGNNGKTTMLNVLIRLFDNKNISSMSLDSLTQRFQIINLQDKLVNICSDISSKYLNDTGVLKGIVTGDTLHAEIKFGASFNFIPTTRLIFSANELPQANDQNPAWYRRINIISFPNQFNESDPGFDRHLEDKLTDELQGIFNWALEGLIRLKENDHFTESDSMKANKQNYKLENDPITAFIEYETETKAESYEIGSVLYQYYKNYCIANGYKNKSRQKFTVDLLL